MAGEQDRMKRWRKGEEAKLPVDWNGTGACREQGARARGRGADLSGTWRGES